MKLFEMIRTSELKYLGLFLGFHLKWQLPFENNVFLYWTLLEAWTANV